jgi:hypothetical protein
LGYWYGKKINVYPEYRFYPDYKYFSNYKFF